MNIRLIVTLSVIILACLTVAVPAFAADSASSTTTEKVVIYETNFSANPSWQTNNPTRYYWDPQKQQYHYLIQPGTGSYAYVPLDYNDESFVLEYDVTPVRSDKDVTFRFGMGSSEMDVSRGTNILSEFSNKKYGKLFWLQVITQSNNLAEVSSAHDSYGGPTINYVDNETYHVTIRYNKELKNADIKVSYKSNQTVVWGYYVNFAQELATLNRLMISSVGEYGNTEAVAEGYIDNVELYSTRTIVITPTPTPVPTMPVTTATTVPPTTVPTTKSPAGMMPVIAAIAITGMCVLLAKKRKQ